MAGTSTAPEWVVKLEYCEQYHLLPWEHFGGSKLLWWYRWKALRDETIKAKQNNG